MDVGVVYESVGPSYHEPKAWKNMNLKVLGGRDESSGSLYHEPGAHKTMNLGVVYESAGPLYHELGTWKTMNLGWYMNLLGRCTTTLGPRRP